MTGSECWSLRWLLRLYRYAGALQHTSLYHITNDIGKQNTCGMLAKVNYNLLTGLSTMERNSCLTIAGSHRPRTFNSSFTLRVSSAALSRSRASAGTVSVYQGKDKREKRPKGKNAVLRFRRRAIKPQLQSRAISGLAWTVLGVERASKMLRTSYCSSCPYRPKSWRGCKENAVGDSTCWPRLTQGFACNASLAYPVRPAWPLAPTFDHS